MTTIPTMAPESKPHYDVEFFCDPGLPLRLAHVTVGDQGDRVERLLGRLAVHLPAQHPVASRSTISRIGPRRKGGAGSVTPIVG